MDQLKHDLSDFDEAYQKLQNELSNLNLIWLLLRISLKILLRKRLS